MKKLLSSMLILTLSFNSFGANCSAVDKVQTKSVFEQVKQINNSFATEENKNTSGEEVSPEAQKEASNPVKNSFREKQIEKLYKEILNLEKTSNKEYFWKRFFINAVKITWKLIILYTMCAACLLFYDKGFSTGQANAPFVKLISDPVVKAKIKPIVQAILKKWHPDNFKRVKNFDDMKASYYYYKLRNFYDEYLK